jgi:hypothetical protein
MTGTTVIEKKIAVKGGKKEKIIGTLAGWLIQLLGCTLRVKFAIPTHFNQLQSPVILTFWHAQIVPATIAWLRKCPRSSPLCALTSASKDGAIIEHAMATFAVRSVRGSSSRRGTAALIELKKSIAAGIDVCITPDGPRGPAQVLQPGLLKLSQLTGAPILPLRIECSRSWRLNTWDRFEIPKPFATLHLCIDEPIFVSRKISDTVIENLRLDIEKRLSEITPIP